VKFGNQEVTTADSTVDWSHATTLTHSEPIVFESDKPTQGHLALTGDPTQMIVMWVTNSTTVPVVQYGTSGLSASTTGTTTTYKITDMCDKPATNASYWIDPGQIHKVLLTGLTPATGYQYRFGNDQDGWSDTMTFTTAPVVNPDRPVSVMVFGDMGVAPGQPFAQPVSDAMVKTVQRGGIDLALHIGDISYARGHAWIWDVFFAEIAPIATRIPYMVSIGNHEFDHYGQEWHPLWSNYGNDSGGECGVPFFKRFSMPNGGTDLWYSFDYGSIHFTLMSCEHNWTPGSMQFLWLEQDLMNVDRSKTPWVIFAGHRPFYQTLDDGEEDPLRVQLRAAIEPLLIKHGVDLALWGHQHYYDRFCKMSNFACDPKGLQNVVIGMAGNDYQEAWRPKPNWSIFRSKDFGYAQVHAANSTAMQFQFWGQNGTALLDQFWITK